MSEVDQLKRLADAKVEEIMKLEGVVAWRILERSTGLSLNMEEAEQRRRLLATKPQTLVASDYVEKAMYRAVADIYRQATDRRVMSSYGTGVFDGGSYFYLEPLSEEEFKLINKTTETQTPDVSRNPNTTLSNIQLIAIILEGK